ncbi:MAG: anaerobic ribonucleoside-triphosphate reductase, partial [Raoultibacter sp.]
KIFGVEIRVEYANTNDAPVSEKEIKAYISRARDLYPNEKLDWLKLEVDGEDVGISYGLAPVPFDRIRRITGYLVGTMDRWNNAKSSEEHDRVKHNVEKPETSFACTNGW